jgi:hypothetical protein
MRSRLRDWQVLLGENGMLYMEHACANMNAKSNRQDRSAGLLMCIRVKRTCGHSWCSTSLYVQQRAEPLATCQKKSHVASMHQWRFMSRNTCTATASHVRHGLRRACVEELKASSGRTDQDTFA